MCCGDVCVLWCDGVCAVVMCVCCGGVCVLW